MGKGGGECMHVGTCIWVCVRACIPACVCVCESAYMHACVPCWCPFSNKGSKLVLLARIFNRRSSFSCATYRHEFLTVSVLFHLKCIMLKLCSTELGCAGRFLNTMPGLHSRVNVTMILHATVQRQVN